MTIATDTTVIEGGAQTGWQVELYRDTELVGFQSVGADGTYTFENVELLFGENRFRIELFGPQGQRETQEKTMTTLDNLPRRGTLDYIFELVAPDQDFAILPDTNALGAQQVDGLVQFQGVYGLGRSLALRTNLSSAWDNQGLDWTTGFGLSGQMQMGLISSDLAFDANGSKAWRLGYSGRIGGASVFIDHEERQSDFVSPAQTLAAQFKTRSSFRVNARWTLPKSDIPLSWGLTGALGVQADEAEFSSLNFRTSALWKRISISNSINFNRRETRIGQVNERQSGSTVLAGRFKGWRVRGGADYELSGGITPRQWSVEASREWGQAKWRTQFQLQRQQQPQNMLYTLGLSRDYDGIRIGVDLRHDENQSATSGRFSISLAMDRDPITGGLRYGRQAKSDRGSAVARLYQDANLNGKRDANERDIQAALIVTDPRRQIKPVPSGGLYLENIAPFERQGLGIHVDALEDPFAIPALDGVAIITRPSVTAKVDLAVLESGEVEVFVRDLNGDVVANTTVRLDACEGKTYIRERTAFDGLALFQFIKPGCYRASVKGGHAVKLLVAAGGVQTIDIEVSRGLEP